MLATTCSEIDNPVVTKIGTTRVLAVDSDLAPQSVSEPQVPVQVAEWFITAAPLSYEGLDEPLELTIDAECRIVDTVYEYPITEGRCLQGLVIDSDIVEPGIQVSYTDLTFTMQVRRAEPVDLPPLKDYDIDRIRNVRDNCPLVYNPDQRDDDGNNIGDACQTELGGFGALLDSDADGVADALDNCVWIPNPLQENTLGLAAEGINDGIGDACVEQLANVNGGQPIQVSSPSSIGLLQPQFGATSVTVDFVNETALTNCTWATAPDAGNCDLVDNSLRYCVSYSLTEAGLLGCQ